MTRRFLLACVVLPFLGLSALLSTTAQSPVALPSTMTTLAGLVPTATTSGKACPTLATAIATDAYGDGCPATNGVITYAYSASGTTANAPRGGVVVDAYGNVFVDDDMNGIVHMINPTTGLMTRVVGGGTSCGAVDLSGDGCILSATSNTAVSGARGIGIDPYGNILLAGFSDKLIHMV